MLKRITFSGIDRWTKPEEVMALHKAYPFVEFAYLYSESVNAGNRYPRPVVMKQYAGMDIPMAVHLCGKVSHELIRTGEWRSVYDIFGKTMDMFERIQLNIPKTRHFSRSIEFPDDKQIIIQLHEGTEALFECYRDRPNVQGFQDASGGRGVDCSEWMYPETEFFGYAGGIGPHNVVEVVQAIEQVCPADYWIDMETHIRTNDRFDIEKCREVCRRITECGFAPA